MIEFLEHRKIMSFLLTTYLGTTMATPLPHGPVFLYAGLVTIFSFGIGQVTGQCPDPVTPCTPSHQTTIDLSTIPECGVGTVNIQGDIQGSQTDCIGTANSGWKCHEFTITRPANSLTHQFTLNIGQGAGCNGELDASYAINNGVCTQLSAGGSQTTITFSFPVGVDSITLFLCLNSSAFVTICNLCAEPPPCTQITDCNLSAITGEGCLADVFTPFTDPADVFTNIGSCAGSTLIMDHADAGDTEFCDANGVDFVRTYTLSFIDTNEDTIPFRICAQNIQVTPFLPSIVCQDITIEGCNTSAITGPAFSTTTAISSEAEFENATNQGSASSACGISAVTYIDVAAGSCPIVVTRTWTVSDACNNSATCNQLIYVDDTTAPACMTQDITISIDQVAGFTNITPAQINNGSSDACGEVTLGLNPNSFTCENVGNNVVTLTVTDVCLNTSTCTATVTVESCYNPCITIVGCVYLEGAASNPNGSNTYSIPMRTTLNQLRVLPGQTYEDAFFGTPHFTPPGQPYSIFPWNYMGLEGSGYNSMGNLMAADAGYPSTVVDWVLVSIRANNSTTTPLCIAAALLHNNGMFEFVEPFDCCDLDLNSGYYLVVEHRNHLIVMSHAPVPIVPGALQSTLTYSFCDQQSYINDPLMLGFVGQKLLSAGPPELFAMYAGNSDQSSTTINDTNIDADDQAAWLNENGDYGEYRVGDHSLNADTNLNDRVIWERNNGKSTSVPR